MDQVLAVSFSPFDSHQLVTCGKQHVTFWELEDSKLKQSRGRLSVSCTWIRTGTDTFGNIAFFDKILKCLMYILTLVILKY